MRNDTPTPADENDGPVPTIEQERHCLAQCDYINRSMTATGVLVRRLLRLRGWREEWSEEAEDTVWLKTFSDGTTEQLNEPDAYFCEEEHTRQFFRDSGIPMKPRVKKPDPE